MLKFDRKIGIFRHIIKYEGFPGLFKGLIPNLIGVAPSRAIYFYAYANTKAFLVKETQSETPLVHVTSAAIAGRAFPFPAVKTMARVRYFQVWRCRH